MAHMAIVAFTIAVTLAAYATSRRVFVRYGWAFLSPVFVSTLLVIATLDLTGLSFEAYRPGRENRTMKVARRCRRALVALPLGPAARLTGQANVPRNHLNQATPVNPPGREAVR